MRAILIAGVTIAALANCPAPSFAQTISGPQYSTIPSAPQNIFGGLGLGMEKLKGMVVPDGPGNPQFGSAVKCVVPSRARARQSSC